MELYEQKEYDNKVQLNQREGDIMKQKATINKKIAGKMGKEYYDDNGEKWGKNIRIIIFNNFLINLSSTE